MPDHLQINGDCRRLAIIVQYPGFQETYPFVQTDLECFRSKFQTGLYFLQMTDFNLLHNALNTSVHATRLTPTHWDDGGRVVVQEPLSGSEFQSDIELVLAENPRIWTGSIYYSFRDNSRLIINDEKDKR